MYIQFTRILLLSLLSIALSVHAQDVSTDELDAEAPTMEETMDDSEAVAAEDPVSGDDAAVSADAATAAVSCRMEGMVRHVEVQYEQARQAIPCQVVYNKETEADSKVLWQAQNQAGYCEEKANEMVAKLESLGWSCEPRE